MGFAGFVAAQGPAEIVVAVVFLAGTAGFGAWRTFKNLKHARLIEDTPTCKARSAPQGYVELEGAGRLMDGPPIVAPLSGMTCVWYRFKVEERVTTRDKYGSRTHWVTLQHGESDEVFWLEDETGRVAIDPDGAEVMPEHREMWHSGLRARRTSLPSYITAFLATHVHKNPYRFTEDRIHCGENLYALGLVKNIGHHQPTLTIEDEVRHILREWKQDQTALKARFDLNQDGRIDEAEWRLARAQARREVRKARTEEQLTAAEPINIMRGTGDRNRPYILSAYPQERLIRRHRRRALLYGALFFLAGGTTVWLINVVLLRLPA